MDWGVPSYSQDQGVVVVELDYAVKGVEGKYDLSLLCHLLRMVNHQPKAGLSKPLSLSKGVKG